MYDDPDHARQCIAEFRERYNNRRVNEPLKTLKSD